MIDGLCHGQSPNARAAIQTGMHVCSEVKQGNSRDSVVYQLSHGEALMPSSYAAPITLRRRHRLFVLTEGIGADASLVSQDPCEAVAFA
ncbi:hypothetical protein KEK_01225 [Mycolicibacterium thermoresistibile ATCC 19527]|uniref:Uncharacterized protein n=2 Tax=Mycolicibacterium thermoresistibile TaxID=1797 RepID=G7CBA3_MYCT3|nr:hypothetical protein KEK_01225 [Mycolicibacterium thermoresistibile ATCC 19527]GAT17634.1 putative uncharacterized protein [Mycolicibacterium thermoresistibile]SNW16294.1 Uncharacterised protein [Mycolicibacterium thermoresistibile]